MASVQFTSCFWHIFTHTYDFIFIISILNWNLINMTVVEYNLINFFFRKKAESVATQHQAPAALEAVTIILAAVHPVQAAASRRPAIAEPLLSPCTTMARVSILALSQAP